jgi:hypothetical protein
MKTSSETTRKPPQNSSVMGGVTATQLPAQSEDSGVNSPVLGGIDLGMLRLPQNFGDTLQVKKLITRIPVRKPNKTEFFRVRPGTEWRFQTMVLEMREDSETFLVAHGLWSTIPELLRPAMLHAAIDRRGNPFLIPVPLPGADGRRNPWHQSLANLVTVAETSWVRLAANMAVGGYDAFIAEGNLAEPEWPDLTLPEMLDTAFRDRVISQADHPVIQQLLGRV